MLYGGLNEGRKVKFISQEVKRKNRRRFKITPANGRSIKSILVIRPQNAKA
jgi:hypothetical protein